LAIWRSGRARFRDKLGVSLASLGRLDTTEQRHDRGNYNPSTAKPLQRLLQPYQNHAHALSP